MDFVLPNFITNKLELVRNPGTAYWNKVKTLNEKYSTVSKERLQSEISKGVEKWKEVKLVESTHSIVIKDFVFVNIDSDEKLAIVLLASDSIRKQTFLLFVTRHDC